MNKEVDDKLLLSETLYLITKFLKSSDGLSEAADALENELVILIIINHLQIIYYYYYYYYRQRMVSLVI